METLNFSGMPPMVDLSTIDEGMRAQAWSGAAQGIFPGLSVMPSEARPQIGAIQYNRMGPGAIFAITSAPAEVRYTPRREQETSQYLTMMLQAGGSTITYQRQRQCELKRGDVCFIDERHPFRLVGTECSQIVILRMPRTLVMSRFPDMENVVATLLPGDDPGTSLLAHMLVQTLPIVAELRDAQQLAAMNAIIHLLGATSGLAGELENVHWRVQRANDFIELNLSVPGLTAEQVAQAQHISRRRLDQLMRDALGVSITGRIWSRRLQRAADDLRDARWAGASISQIAFASGFEDPAHFARAFKRRFESTPGQWRAAGRPVSH